jgi:hypothetical protein
MMSGQTSTAGQLPLPAGWKSAASQAPSAVFTSTSFSTTSDWASALAGRLAATAVMTPKLRRESRWSSTRPG